MTKQEKHVTIPLSEDIGRNGIMFIFKDNEQINTELKVILTRENTSGAKTAKKMGISQQNYFALTHKKNLAFTDIQRILDALGYDLEINFKKREEQ